MTDEHISKMHEGDYKKLVKTKVYFAAFQELEQLKEAHSKVSDNQYTDLKHIQPYFQNRKLTNFNNVFTSQ